MLTKAVYSSGEIELETEVEKIDILIESDKEILNFPRVFELDQERLVMVYGKGRHGGDEIRAAAVSEDFGRTWMELEDSSPWADYVMAAGILGYMKDGTITYIDATAIECHADKWKRQDGPWHLVHRVEDPTFRIRRFDKRGELLSDGTFKIQGFPWKISSYEFYGTLLEAQDGSNITAFQALPEYEKQTLTVSIGKSFDNCKTFEVMHVFDSADFDLPRGHQGFCEPDMAILANGDILCIMRTGSYTPMYQSRSKDAGVTWSDPESIGWPGVKPALKLLENGVLACSGGRGAYGQPQVTYAMFSLDGTGERWEYPFAFHTGPGCSYTSNMARNGRFYVIYSDSDFTKEFGTNRLSSQAIKRANISVEKKI